MKECKCKDWKENLPIINSAIVLQDVHGFGSLKKSFNYCPYCGIKLKAQKKKRGEDERGWVIDFVRNLEVQKLQKRGEE